MSIIDVFSVGKFAIPVGTCLKQAPNAAIGIAVTLPLLFTAVADGKLTIDDIKARLHDNPKQIFPELHDQMGASAEVEIDRPYTIAATPVWSPFAGKIMRGAVQRVVFQEKTACLDGEPCYDGVDGKDMSSHLIDSHTVSPMSPVVKAMPSSRP